MVTYFDLKKLSFYQVEITNYNFICSITVTVKAKCFFPVNLPEPRVRVEISYSSSQRPID